MFSEGFRDKIFNTEIIAALGRALSDKTSRYDHLRISAVNFFTAAVAQGARHFFDGILIPKYLQRGFGTRYLTLRSLPHWGVYHAMKPPTSETVWSHFSLLLWLKVRSVFFLGYSYQNICRGDLGQDIWHWDHRRTSTWTKRWKRRPQKQCNRNFHCCHCSRCAPFFLQDFHTEVFAEAVWDKIFATEIIAALGRAISDTISDAGYSAIKFFTVAVAQGTLGIFRIVFMPK